MMLQLTRTGFVHDGQLDAARDRFATNHCVVLEKLLEPALVEMAQRHMQQTPWQSTDIDGIGTLLTLDDGSGIARALSFVVNTPEFLNVIRIITGRDHISEFKGTVYRLAGGPQQHLSWHNDMQVPMRYVGFSINLSTDVFRGGTFELREARTLAPLAQVNNTGFGDAILFRISKDLQHRVTEVVGEVAKTAYAGWFYETGVSSFAELVKPRSNDGTLGDASQLAHETAARK
jgi:hypothetical protein